MTNNSEKWYFETSGFNYLLKAINFDSFLNTRELQEIKGRELLVSPITLWEIMLTDDNSDFLVFSAQNLFNEKLLATPTEIIMRYLDFAYPANKINYPITTDLEIGNLWSKMTTDNSIKFIYDKEKLKDKTRLIRNISKNLSSILNNSVNPSADDFLKSTSKIVTVYYECLRDDGFLPKAKGFDEDILFKLVVLFVLILFILKLDIDSSVVDSFWKKENIDSSNPTNMLVYFFEKYPLILKKGPFLEMALMAYNQVKLGKTNRGLILDCYHMIYAPYVNWIVTGDEGFSNLKQVENRYERKIIHISELNFGIVPYIKKSNE